MTATPEKTPTSSGPKSRTAHQSSPRFETAPARELHSILVLATRGNSPLLCSGAAGHRAAHRSPYLLRSDRQVLSASLHNRRNTMKTILSALVALSVLAGVAGSVQAADFGSQDYWTDLARHQN